MAKELEIEYKNMLTKEEYLRLLGFFTITEEQIKTQVNHYFDTEDFKLKEKQCALRIREKDGQYECTLKTPAPEGNFEFTDHLEVSQAIQMINGGSFQTDEVEMTLNELGIDSRELKLFGSLTTHRAEFPYEDGLLVLDHSEYGEVDDYEVEFEVQDAELGQKQFWAFLNKHQLPQRPADKKIARFMKAVHRKPEIT